MSSIFFSLFSVSCLLFDYFFYLTEENCQLTYELDAFLLGHSLMLRASDPKFSRWLRTYLIFYFLQVCNTFRDLEESNILQPYMRDAIIEISKACEAFEAKESAPSIAGILAFS